MNLSQIARLQALKKHLETFRKNHPKFPSFLNAVSHNALEEGTVIEISVTSPSDKNYVTNIKLRQDDLEIIISRRRAAHQQKPEAPKGTFRFFVLSVLFISLFSDFHTVSR